MSIWDAILLATSALKGGLVGAASRAYLNGQQLGGVYGAFRSSFEAYLSGRTDPASEQIRAEFVELDASWKRFGASLTELGHAAKIKR